MTFISLELFSGAGTISKSFSALGATTYTVDWSTKINADLHADVSMLSLDDIIHLCDRVPDVVWASPQCTTYSIATHRHRSIKNNLVPETALAVQDDKVNKALWNLIDVLLEYGTKYYFVENPKGRMRHMYFVKDRPRYTISYCSYGLKGFAKGFENTYIMKPTDIWTNHPNPKFLSLCNAWNPPHVHGTHGAASKRDYLSRSMMPKAFADHIAHISML